MTKILSLLIATAISVCTTSSLVAYDNGYGDADMPTAMGGCANAIGCHTRNATGSIALTSAADDGTWDTPGESGTITATVNIDAVADDDSLPGVALLDANLNVNIKVAGWSVTSDPNSNPSPFNYNEREHVLGDEVFVWNVTAPSTPGTYAVLGRMLYGRGWYNEDTVLIAVTTGLAEGTLGRGIPHDSGLTVYPNPFSRSANITYSLVEPGNVLLTIHDVSGRRVRETTQHHSAGGMKTLVWDGRDDSGNEAPQGLYFFRLLSDYGVSTAKVVLLE